MRTLFLLAALIIGISATGQTPDMMKYYQATKQMIKEGNYKEALERSIWFHDHVLEKDSDMRGIRLSYALSDWVELGDKYPPALTALVEIRDRKTRQVIETPGPPGLFNDVVSINSYLKQDAKSINLFSTIEKKDSALAINCWYWIEEELFSAKRYDILGRYLKKPMLAFQADKKQLEEDTATDIGNVFTHYLNKAASKNSFVVKCVQLIQFCFATNNVKDAQAIQQEALRIVDDNRLRDAIPGSK